MLASFELVLGTTRRLRSAVMHRWVLLTCLLCLALVPHARARIGETPEQCEARYGKPYKTGDHVAYYLKSGLLISVNFFEGKADALAYRKQEKNFSGVSAVLSENEIEQLKIAEGNGQDWVSESGAFGERCWVTQKDRLTAMYSIMDHVLAFFTQARMDRVNAATKAAEDQKLKGL